MTTLLEPPATAKPELILRSPQFKALGGFLFLAASSSALFLHQTYAYFTDGSHYVHEYYILLFLASAVSFFSIVVANVVTQRTLLVYPEGFAFVVGKQASFCRWDDVVSIERHLARNSELDLPRSTYWVNDRHGHTFKLHDFRLDHTDCFGEWYLIPRVRERLTAAAPAEYDAGRDVRFGPFCVNESGFHYKGSTLAWEDLAEVEADLDGDLVVRKRGTFLAWCEPCAKAIPNLFVLLDVLEMRHRNRVIVKNSILEWWAQLPQPHWNRDFGNVRLTRDGPNNRGIVSAFGRSYEKSEGKTLRFSFRFACGASHSADARGRLRFASAANDSLPTPL